MRPNRIGFKGLHLVSKWLIYLQLHISPFTFGFIKIHEKYSFVVPMLNLKSSKMNTSIKIICKKQPHANGLYPIYLRVTINRKSKFYSTPFTCKLTEWDHKQGEFKSKYKNHLTFNKTLRKLKDNASDVVNLLEQDYES